MNPHTRRQAMRLVAAVCTLSAISLANAQPAAAAAAKPDRSSAWVVASGKPNGSGVVLRYQVPQAFKPGVTTTVRLQFSGITDSRGASLELRASDPAVTLYRNGAVITDPIELLPEQGGTLEVQVRATVDGVFYLNVLTGQGQRVTAIAVPLRVGTGVPRLKSVGKPKTTLTGEKVIVLQGQ